MRGCGKSVSLLIHFEWEQSVWATEMGTAGDAREKTQQHAVGKVERESTFGETHIHAMLWWPVMR